MTPSVEGVEQITAQVYFLITHALLEAEITILCPTYQKKNHLVQDSVLER